MVENKKNRTIQVDYLARVEGEGGLSLKIRNDRVENVELKIFEPPRFFEAFLQGRRLDEAPDITARICGICPVAYQMSACNAMEDALGYTPDSTTEALRRLLYCGEWIESHTLHVYMLHAPDFLGYAGAVEMAADHPDVVKRGLRLKKIGNEILKVLGGREIHPINVKVGGFYRYPSFSDFRELTEEIKWAHQASIETVRWVAGFDFKDFNRSYEWVALSHPDEYPMNRGRIVSSKGLNIAVSDFEKNFQEEHVEHSNALHCRIKERGSYFVGPLARYNLNHSKLSPTALEVASEVGLGSSCNNPFQSIIVRSIELVHACEEALRLIQATQNLPTPQIPDLSPLNGIGHGATEAPRGILYHKYQINKEGLIEEAQIVPPTSQNQLIIEEDLADWVDRNPGLEDEKLTWTCEQAIRNYDPCISCATHFLNLNLDRQ